VTLYPGVVYGPARRAGHLRHEPPPELVQGPVGAAPGGGRPRWCLAWVEDVAEGFRLALERAAPGERVHLGGENASLAELFSLAREISGLHPRPFPSVWAAKGAGLLEVAGPSSARAEGGHAGAVEVARHDWALSSEKARHDLGYPVTPFGGSPGDDRLDAPRGDAPGGGRRAMSFRIETGRKFVHVGTACSALLLPSSAVAGLRLLAAASRSTAWSPPLRRAEAVRADDHDRATPSDLLYPPRWRGRSCSSATGCPLAALLWGLLAFRRRPRLDRRGACAARSSPGARARRGGDDTAFLVAGASAPRGSPSGCEPDLRP